MGFLILQTNLHYLPLIICPPPIGEEEKSRIYSGPALKTSSCSAQVSECPPQEPGLQNRPASWWTLQLTRGAGDFLLKREELILSLTEKPKRLKEWNSSPSTCSCQQSPYLQGAEAFQMAIHTPCRASGEPGNSQHYSLEPFKPPAKATWIIF